MALRAAAGTAVRGLGSLRQNSLVATRAGEVFLPRISAACSPFPSGSRLLSTKESDTLLRDNVRQAVLQGLRAALTKCNTDDGSQLKLSIIKEGVTTGLYQSLKQFDVCVDCQDIDPFLRLMIQDAVDEGLKSDAMKLMIEAAVQEGLKSDALYLTIKQAAEKELKLDLDGPSKAQEFVFDEKFAAALENFTDAMNNFMLVYNNIFTAEDGVEGMDAGAETEGGKADGEKTTKDGGQASSEGDTERGYSGAKTGKAYNKFDLYLKKYDEDNLQIVRVLNLLLQNSELLKEDQMKSKDFVADWCNETADAYIGKVRMDKLRKVMTLVPYCRKGYFYYLFLKMMEESKIPPWHYPMVVRATRLLLVKQALDVYNKAKKLEDKSDDKKDDDPPE